MREEKQLRLEELGGKIERHPSFLIMSYFQIDANTTNEFRNQIAKLGGEVEVVPKRIFTQAAAAKGIELSKDWLKGHIGLVFAGEDALETMKAVYQFGKEQNDQVIILGSRINGELYSREETFRFSTLPPRPQMCAELLGLFEAPLSQLLGVMDALLCSLLHCLENRIKKEGEGGN